MRPIILTSVFLLSVLSASSAGQSILWAGDSISVEDASSHTLVSPSGNFSCGFHKVATNAYTFSIWFTRSADATVVWTASRDAPVNGRGSRAEFRKDGSLVIQDFDGQVAWSTNTSGTQADRVQLLDTGNLVVADAGGRELWQSFEWPTDTLLPGQPITRYKRLVSASARGLPYSGFYNLYFDSNNILNLMYDGPDISSNYWPPPDLGWQNNRTAYNSSRFGSLDKSGVFTATDNTLLNASDMGDAAVMRRLTLDYDGNLRIDWSKGCKRQFDLRCDDDKVRFDEMPHVDFYGFDFNYTPGLTFDKCQQICLADCSCEAFGYKGTGECYPKFAMWNGKVPNPWQAIYLKVPTRVRKLKPTVLDSHGHTCLVQEREANVSSSYLQVKGNKINFAYFYWFLAAVFVVEAIFMAVGYLFVFRAEPHTAATRVRVDEEGYAV
ncbi:hypothetical protein EJB05_13319, partial [Eragrostis curvula]